MGDGGEELQMEMAGGCGDGCLPLHPDHLVHPVKNRFLRGRVSFPVTSSKSFKTPNKTTFLGSFLFCIPYARKMCQWSFFATVATVA
jgi:hypothetical protein